jgi:dipeptidyl aminopeptidase/acylaminoacyl peptidase
MMFSPLTGRAAFARLLLTLALALDSAAAVSSPVRETSGAELRALASRHAALPPAPAIADDDLMRRSAMRQVRMAPDSSKIAWLKTSDGMASLYIYDVASHASRILLKEAPHAEYSWSRGSRILFAFSADGVTAIDTHDGRTTRIATFDASLERQVAGIDPSRPQHIMMDEYDRKSRHYRLFTYAAGGQREQLYEGPQLRSIALDGQGKLAFIKTFDAQYNQIISRRDGTGWREIARCRPVRTCTLQSASSDGCKLYLIAVHNGDRSVLFEIDAASGKRRILHEDPQAIADLRAVTLSPDSNQPLIASYDLPRRRNYALTPASTRGVADISSRFGDANIAITPAAHDKPWLLAESSSLLQQERFWLYHPKQRSFERILNDVSGANLQLAAKLPIHYRVSDGMLIHGYLTLPRGVPATRLPIVTFVHGGPWSRVDSEFHWLPQWLANRGYAVFQPNFRASTGYGDHYMLAARMDFGNGRVQRDITDGVQWLLANGIGSKDRLAIIGDSFGGYSTLLALTHTPNLFQFGLAGVPPPDFTRIIRLALNDKLAKTEDLPTSVRFGKIGISMHDVAAISALAAAAPAANVNEVRKPLVILAGARDQMVEIAAVTDYASRLQAAGKPISLLVDPTEGHNARKPVTRSAYVLLLGRLLHDYLGGPEAATVNTELKAYLEQNMQVNNAFRTIP